MRYALLCLLFSVSLSAQPTAKLNSDLIALANPNASTIVLSARITDDILALADKTAPPSRQATLDFTNELSKALNGKAVRPQNVESVSGAIVVVLLSSGVSSSQFHGSLDHFRDALIALGASPLQARTVAGRLLILGQEIRGPEDFRVAK